MQASTEKTTSERAAPVAIFKLIVVGDSEIGKSTLIKKFSTGILEELTINDQKIIVHKTRFPTSIGDIQFNIWDLDRASVETESPQEFFAGADCAILMFDTTSRMSYKNTPFWFNKIRDVNQDELIPTILVGNKADVENRKVKLRQITFHRKRNLAYNDISAEANYEIEKPFIYLARRLVKDQDLSLFESPVVQPPGVMMDQALLKSLEAQLKEFEAPIVFDDDDL